MQLRLGVVLIELNRVGAGVERPILLLGGVGQWKWQEKIANSDILNGAFALRIGRSRQRDIFSF